MGVVGDWVGDDDWKEGEQMSEVCEWNPTLQKPAVTGNEPTDCKNEARVSIGAKASDNWHLCESCAALPAFKKYRHRELLNRARLATEVR